MSLPCRLYNYAIFIVFKIHPHKISYLIKKYKTLNNLFSVYFKLISIINSENLKFYNSVSLGIFLEGFTNIIMPKRKHNIIIKDSSSNIFLTKETN